MVMMIQEMNYNLIIEMAMMMMIKLMMMTMMMVRSGGYD